MEWGGVGGNEEFAFFFSFFHFFFPAGSFCWQWYDTGR